MEQMNHILEIIYSSNIINFLLVVAFLVWLTKKYHLLSAITDKQDIIAKTVHNAEEDKAKAEKDLQESHDRIKNLGDETQKITEEAKGIADSLAERIRVEAQLNATDIHKKADRAIEVEKEMASNEVLQDISRAAYNIAEKHVKQAIDTRLHKKYIDEFIDNLDNAKV
jgi:ATP synthase F0 subunit b